MKNKNNKKILNLVLIICLFQIILLITLPFASSYFINQTFNPDTNKKMQETKKDKNSFMNSGLNLLISFFSIKQIGIVSAQTLPDLGCCIETDLGDPCAMVEENSCTNSDFYPGSTCTGRPECKEGLCYDGNEGTCTPTKKVKCPNINFLDLSDPLCQKGCCIVGNNIDLVTERRCEIWSGGENDAWYPSITSELECLAELDGLSEDIGACITIGGRCEHIMEKDCTGEFVEGFCSSPAAQSKGSTCGTPKSKGCVDEKSEVYDFDSCGNREGIASGKACDGVNNQCGYSATQNDYICESISCTSNGQTYMHGESWCVFDSKIGEQSTSYGQISADPPGSVHWKASCINGEVKINPCDGTRGKVCTEAVMGDIGNKEFTSATCEFNRDLDCKVMMGDYLEAMQTRIGDNPDLKISKKDKEKEVENKQTIIEDISEEERAKLQKECEKNLQCRYENIEISEHFEFPTCVGKYPQGGELGEAFCGMASRTCPAIFTKNAAGRYKCEYNCECLEEDFVQKMNNFCVSLGDCGSYINYKGGFSDNIGIKVSPEMLDAEPINKANDDKDEKHLKKWGEGNSKVIFKDNDPFDLSKWIDKNTYSRLVAPVSGQKVPSIADELATEDPSRMVVDAFGGYSNLRGLNFLNLMGGVAGATGITILLWELILFPSTAFFSGGTAFTQVALPIIGLALGAMLGNQVAKWTGQGGDGQIMYIIGFALVGLGGGILLTIAIFGGANFWNPVGWITLIVGALTALWALFSGVGKTAQVDVEFSCLPWEAPTGSADCEKCNEDEGRQCTKERCESLGQGCEVLEGTLGTDEPTCIGICGGTPSPSVITPGDAQQGYRLVTSTTNKDFKLTEGSSGCIEEQNEIGFNLKADEYVQCKYSFKEPTSYELMESNYPSGSNSYLKEHKFTIDIPSLNSLDLEDGDDTTLYVSCQDKCGAFTPGGYSIDMCIKELADETPPIVEIYAPENEKEYPYNPQPLLVKAFVNEPSSCSWDISSKPYEDMANSMGECSQTEQPHPIYPLTTGHVCSDVFTDLTPEINTFYIKCKDASGNIGESEYKLKVLDDISKEDFISTNGLEITSYSPQEETITTGDSPPEIELEIQTSKGANNGDASCGYSFTSFSNTLPFLDTLSTSHKQVIGSGMASGDYTVYIKCEDLDKISSAETTIDFTLNIDQDFPLITEDVAEGDFLTIKTDEEAKCAYTPSSCNFNIEEGIEFDFGYDFVTEQKTEWNPAITYFVRCLDKYGNEGCSGQIGEGAPTGPVITRIKYDNGNLKINTDRSAQCYYDYNSCAFSIVDNENLMSTNFVKEHRVDWNPATKYHIKCEDKWGSVNPGCATIVQPYSIKLN